MNAGKKVAVIGGGAAGMMAAIAAAEAGAEVILLEKNEKTGKKIYITGKGRCNLTNSCADEDFFSHVVSNPKFLYSAVYGFDSAAVCGFFERAGLRLKEERGGRIFPASDHASDVIRALNGRMEELGVEVRLNSPVRSVSREYADHGAGGFVIALSGRESVRADSLIVACGGKSYPATGSDGKLYEKLCALGHSIKEPLPALVPFDIAEKEECAAAQGLALKNVGLSVKDGKKTIYEGFGEMLYTHFGLSGPLVLTASSYYQKKHPGEAKLFIDLKPALSHEQLDARVLREFEENKNKDLSNVLGSLLPGKLREVFPDRLGIPAGKKVNSITREERRILVETLKSLEYNITGCRGFEEAIITQGGVNVKEVDPSTMESRIVPGLYFAGEVLDVDAHTGGYNLQIAWSTGHLAGLSAAAALP
ncbi:MAG: NAD(P)/FAD-dependent oxidoreductase [Lachnospiraceae bacterium]|nr:NAD(P)/FAD-dependent oxidoreductase [Lachnospiraceae bacterium]